MNRGTVISGGTGYDPSKGGKDWLITVSSPFLSPVRAVAERQAMLDFLWRSLVIGIGGTAAMDLWALVLTGIFGLPLPNWGLAGRWFAHLAKGTFFHKDIAEAQAIPNEAALGWFAHYAIGIVYAGALIVFAGPSWISNPTFLPAWILGLVTVGAGWFILQPGMGAGWAASLRPHPMRIRALNLTAHTVFAAGLYGTALLIANVSTELPIDSVSVDHGTAFDIAYAREPVLLER